MTNKHGFKVDNSYYYINKKGLCKKVNQTRGMAGLQYDKCGGTVWKAFLWAAELERFSMPESSQNKNDAWQAAYAFTYNKGDCRNQAAAFYYMIKAANVSMSKTAVMVNGKTEHSGGELKDHSWVEATINGTIKFFDPNAYSELQKFYNFSPEKAKQKSFNFTYGTKETFKYQDEHNHK